MKKLLVLISATMIFMGFTMTASATLLNYEGFDYSNGESLEGLSGGIGWGSNAWAAGSGSGSMSISGGSLGYPSGTSLSPIGGNTVATGTTTTMREFDGHSIDLGSTGTTYFSVLMQKTVNNGSADGFDFHFTKSGSTFGIFNFGMGASEGFFMNFGGNNFGPSFVLNEDYLFVGKINANATGDDSVQIQVYASSDTVGFIDPVVWTMEKAYDSSDVLTGVALRSVYNTENAFYDEIRIGTTWSDVALQHILPEAAVPEPTTIVLLGIGLVGLAGAEVRRRRKKSAEDKS